MRKRLNTGKAILGAIFLTMILALAVAATLNAANPSAPSGWLLTNRDRALHAMGTTVTYRAVASSTTVVTATGILATDIVCGIVNLSDPTEVQGLNSIMTPTSGTITASSATFAATEVYLVTLHRKKSLD